MTSALLKLGLLSRAGKKMLLPMSAGHLSNYLTSQRSAVNDATADTDKIQDAATTNLQNTTGLTSQRSFTNQGVTSGRRDALYQRLEVEVRGHDAAVLKSYEWYALQAAEHLGVILSKKWVPPKHLLRRDTLKSVHIYKKHMVQYEARTYFRVMEFKFVTESTADTYLEYIQRNLPEGVAMIVTKHELEKIPSHIKPMQSTATSGDTT